MAYYTNDYILIEKLPENNLPLPSYDVTDKSFLNFQACLTRPCIQVPEGVKRRNAFVCCDKSQPSSFIGPLFNGIMMDPATIHATDDIIELSITNKRLNVDISSEDWHNYAKSQEIRLTVWPGEVIMIPVGVKIKVNWKYSMMVGLEESLEIAGLDIVGRRTYEQCYTEEIFIVVYNRNRSRPIIINHGDIIAYGAFRNAFKLAIKHI